MNLHFTHPGLTVVIDGATATVTANSAALAAWTAAHAQDFPHGCLDDLDSLTATFRNGRFVSNVIEPSFMDSLVCDHAFAAFIKSAVQQVICATHHFSLRA